MAIRSSVSSASKTQPSRHDQEDQALHAGYVLLIDARARTGIYHWTYDWKVGNVRIDHKLVVLILVLGTVLFVDTFLLPFGLLLGSIIFLGQLLVGTVIVYKGLTSS